MRLGDRRGAFSVVEEAFASGLEIERLYLGVIQPALREIGELWHANQLSVAEEHLATAITQTVMARLYGRIFDDQKPGGPTLLGVCASSERHEIGLRMVCDLLELSGWDTSYLGSCPPLDDLLHLLERRRPRVLAFSAAISRHLAEIGAAIEGVRGHFGDEAPLIIAGGLAFLDEPGLAMSLGAQLTAVDAADAVDALNRQRS